METLTRGGGWYEAICDKKMNPAIVEEDEEQQTLKPDVEKENEEAQSKIEKNSCAWFTENSQSKIEFHNYTGTRICDL